MSQKRRKFIFPKRELHLFGSSHFGVHRNFGALFREGLQSTIIQQKFKFNPLNIHSYGGCTLLRSISDILSKLTQFKEENRRSCIVVHLGDNDLRRASKQKEVNPGEWELDYLLRYLKILSISATRMCVVIILNLFPSPASSDHCNQLFQRFNEGLKDLKTEHCYVVTNTYPFTIADKPNYDLYAKDGIHLNTKGTELFVEKIIKALIHISK